MKDSCMFGTIPLLEVVQQPIQVNLRLQKMSCTDCPYPKTWVWTPEPSLQHAQKLSYTQVRISLLENVLGLLQHVRSVLVLQVNLSPLKIISNDCPCPKTWGFQHVSETYLAILRGMIFPTFFFDTPPKNDENVKKSKNREHFIISVFKVGQGKNFLFL